VRPSDATPSHRFDERRLKVVGSRVHQASPSRSERETRSSSRGRTVMENLERSRRFNLVISRSGKVLKK